MTAIAGIAEGGKVWIGSDSAGSDGCSMTTRLDPKVFINGDFIFGYTSSFRMGQILEYEFQPPTPHENESGMAYMVRRFIPSVRDALKAGGFGRCENGQEVGGDFLVGYRGELYEIQSDYQVSRKRQNYNACGGGHDLILGSLHATDNHGLPPDERITMAIEAAIAFSAGVRGPCTILSI